MLIRNATENDAQRIIEISRSLTISRDSTEASGFVEYTTPDEVEMKERILESSYFYVAEDDSRNVVGFFSNYQDNKLAFLRDDEITAHISRKPMPFVYCDQMGIDRAYQRRGATNNFWARLFTDIASSDYRTLWTAVSHRPIRNNRVAQGIVRFGFVLEEELEVYNGLTFGIYRKRLSF